jgi:hypothetical protein
VAAAVDVGSVAFVLWSHADLDPVRHAGIRWHIHVARADDGGVEWLLDPLPV